jgi:hypothetical protein
MFTRKIVKKYSDQENKKAIELLKSGLTTRDAFAEYNKKYKKEMSLSHIKELRLKNKTEMPKTRAEELQLSEEQGKYISGLIKRGFNTNRIQQSFLEKYKRVIHRDTINKFSKQNSLKIQKEVMNIYSKEEKSILKGLWLNNLTLSHNIANEIPNRSLDSVLVQIKKMKAIGEINETIKDAIISEISLGETIKSIAEKYNVKEKFIEMYSDKISKNTVEIQNLKKWEEQDVESAFDMIEEARKRIKGLESEQSEANINIKTKSKYIGIAFMSDLHLENINTDTTQMRKDFKIIQDNPNLYMGFGGDIIDNFYVSLHKDGLLESTIPPKAARIIAGKLFDSVKGKLLWSILGCHDNWDKSFADYNLPEHIARKLSVPYLGHGGDINLKINNNIEYLIHARHKYRGSSGLNNGTACCKNILKEINPKFQIVSVGHNHFAEIKLEHFLGQTRCFIRNGSYKKEDGYSKSLGYQQNAFNIQIPVVILNTKTNQLKVVSGIDNAADLLNALNK